MIGLVAESVAQQVSVACGRLCSSEQSQRSRPNAQVRVTCSARATGDTVPSHFADLVVPRRRGRFDIVSELEDGAHVRFTSDKTRSLSRREIIDQLYKILIVLEDAEAHSGTTEPPPPHWLDLLRSMSARELAAVRHEFKTTAKSRQADHLYLAAIDQEFKRRARSLLKKEGDV